MRVTLVRHGAIDRTLVSGCRHDPDLTATGRREVTRLAASDRLGPAPDVVLRSPARRSAATAALLGWNATVVEAWRERDLGDWEGRRWAELWGTAPAAVQHDPAAFAAFTPPGGESVAALRARTRQALERLPRAEHVAVVTHAGPIVAALAVALDLSAEVSLRLRVGTATVTRFHRYGDGTVTVEAVGA